MIPTPSNNADINPKKASMENFRVLIFFVKYTKKIAVKTNPALTQAVPHNWYNEESRGGTKGTSMMRRSLQSKRNFSFD